MSENVYIHIPFCRQKCNYCSFISYSDLEKKRCYLSKLKEEIKHFYNNEQIKTLYLGGGTPSLLSSDEIFELIKLFNVSDNTEVTIELNPENINKDYLYSLKNTGINRLSFGCQSFDDKTLSAIGRKHTSFDAITAINTAKSFFDNISLDLIYGLPEQSIKDFEKDLMQAGNLEVQHVSLYGLKIEEGCYFASHMPANLPDNDIQAEMYLKAINILTQNGFEHYEISNFAKTGFYSKHNLNYWNNNFYYGFGIAAHGYINNIRYSNFENFSDYFKDPCRHAFEHIVSKNEKLEEEIFLGLRKMSGISSDEINKKFGIDFEQKYSSVLNKYITSGHIKHNNGIYSLSDKGILVSNIILSEFLED